MADAVAATPHFITGLDEFEKHLSCLLTEPETAFNAQLFDDIELQLADFNIALVLPILLPNLSQLLLTYHDAAHIPAVASITTKLLRLTEFKEAVQLATEEGLIQALRSSIPSVNILAIQVIAKAAQSVGYTSILSDMRSLLLEFLRTWLCTLDMFVANLATKVLGDLLTTDYDPTLPTQGLLWRRVFRCKEHYELLLSRVSLKKETMTASLVGDKANKIQITLAQGRLLDLLPRLAALDFYAVSDSPPLLSALEEHYSMQDEDHGLLFFAGVKMVDLTDYLMQLTLWAFFFELFREMSATERKGTVMERLKSLYKRALANDPMLQTTIECMARAYRASENAPGLELELDDFLMELQILDRQAGK